MKRNWLFVMLTAAMALTVGCQTQSQEQTVTITGDMLGDAAGSWYVEWPGGGYMPWSVLMGNQTVTCSSSDFQHGSYDKEYTCTGYFSGSFDRNVTFRLDDPAIDWETRSACDEDPRCQTDASDEVSVDGDYRVSNLFVGSYEITTSSVCATFEVESCTWVDDDGDVGESSSGPDWNGGCGEGVHSRFSVRLNHRSEHQSVGTASEIDLYWDDLSFNDPGDLNDVTCVW
jgi:hypothetical protein